MDRLPAGGRLDPGDQLVSPNGRVRLVLQADGNLVLYRTDDNRALWSSGTHGKPVADAVMQDDGNLVASTASGVPCWASGSHGHPGAALVVQDDGNVVIYAGDRPVWATHTMQRFGPARVGAFRPSTHAPLFSNATGWPAGTHLPISVLGLPPVSIDVTKMGLCGGMSFLARDTFESGTPQLRGRDSTHIPRALAQHILSRLLDSFGGAGVVNRWLSATRALDHDSRFRGRGLFRETVGELPGILDDIDAGRLCPIGLVLTHSYAPWAVFENHVVLVWGYERTGDVVTLRVYDSNRPNRDDIVIQLDLSGSAPIATNGTSGSGLRGLFRLPYRRHDPAPAYIDDGTASIESSLPAALAPGATAEAVVTVRNTGSTTWTSGYALGGSNAVDLPHGVDPGETARFAFTITAPAEPGRHSYAWRMRRAGVPFGTPTATMWMTVGAGAPDGEQALLIRAESLTRQLAEVGEALDRLDWADPATARERATGLSRQAREVQRQLAAIESGQPQETPGH